MNENEKTIDVNKPSYSTILYDLWKRIILCIVGWAIACIGFVVMGNSTLPGLLLILAGAVVVELPCYKLLLAGGGIAALLASSFKDQLVTTHYSDGSTSKHVESAAGARMVVRILTWIVTLVIGAFVVVFNIFKDYTLLMKMQDPENPPKDWKEKPWAPIAVGLGAFVLFIVLAVIISSIISTVIYNKDDYTDEETVALIDQLVADMSATDFTYVDQDGSEVDYAYVAHDGKGDQYYAKFNETAKADLKLSAAEYIRMDGVWYVYDATNKATGAAAPANEAAELNKFTFAGLIAQAALKENIKDVTVRNQDASGFFGYDAESEQVLIFHNKKGPNEKDFMELVFGLKGEKQLVYTFKFPYSYVPAATWLNFEYGDVNIESYFTKE